MRIEIDPNNVWYHGSNLIFDVLEIGSTITQWRELAEAFSHKPTMLCFDDNGIILHNGNEKGYLYVIDEYISLDNDVCCHPRTTMGENAEFLTTRPLRVKLLYPTKDVSVEDISVANKEFERLIKLK